MSANSEMLGVKESDSPFVRKHLGSRCSPSLSRKEKNSDYFHAVSSSLKPGDVAVEHLVLGASGLFRSLKFRWILRRKILPTDDQRIYHMPPRQFSILMSVFLLSLVDFRSYISTDKSSENHSDITSFCSKNIMLNTTFKLKKCLLSFFLYTT